ncbi:MAG: glycosyltransferase family 39 protein [Desulfomonile tiedjei]|uniref:Glycosyltransferase family 39 protein n=1 Tax=Desulfomonile tiedjei TaxID=2358 RepID=A0A9D6Z6B2_9BACT|nr:glycosyltransferase family 39 protein [Desulfomonile tiedjei]
MNRKYGSTFWTTRALVAVALLVTAAIRIAVPFAAFVLTNDVQVFHTPDTASFVRPAIGLTSTWSFAVDGTPEILRTPGYPFFLIPAVASGHLELVAIALQVILSVLTAYGVFEIALLVFQRDDAAILSTALYAVEPLSVLYTSLLMSEALFSFCIVLSLYFFLRYLNDFRWSNLLGSAVALSASVYVRPVAYLLPLLLSTILLFWMLVGRDASLKRVMQTFVFFLVCVSLISAWQFRNYKVAGYAKFSAIHDYDMYFYAGASVLAQENRRSLSDQQKLMGLYDWEVYFGQHPEQRTWNRSDVYNYMGEEGLKTVARSPLTYLRASAKGPFTTLLGPGLSSYLVLFRCQASAQSWGEAAYHALSGSAFIEVVKKAPAVVWWGNFLLGGMLLAYLLLSLTALLSPKREWRNNLIGVAILVMVSAYFIVVPLNTGHSRFREPAMPIICVLAGCGMATAIAYCQRLMAALRGKFSK